jgi:hypothetical protein
MRRLLLLGLSLVILMPGIAAADIASVPAPCRDALAARWPGWRLSPPPRDYAAYARQKRLETNVAKGDFDDDGTPDVAVLLLTSSTRRAQRHLAVCLARPAEPQLHVIREPYCGDGIGVSPKGTQAYDYEREDVVTYRLDGVATVCFEKAGATYLFEKSRFRRVIDSD